VESAGNQGIAVVEFLGLEGGVFEVFEGLKDESLGHCAD